MNIATPATLQHIGLSAAERNKGAAHQKRIIATLPIAGNNKLIRKMSQDAAAGIGGKRASSESTLSMMQRLAAVSAVVCSPFNREAAKKFFAEKIEALSSADNGVQIGEMVAATMGDDADAKAARAALGKMIAENVGHLIRYTGSYMQWYQSVSLAEDDKPYLRNFVPQECNIRIGTADGYLTTHDVQPDDEDDKAIPLFFVLSDMIRAKLFDEYKGNIANAGLAVVDIAADLADKIDSLLQLPFLVGTPNSVYTAAFVNDGTTASHFHASARINTANYPAGNIIAPSTNGVGSKPRFDCIRVIDKYFSQFGAGFSPSGDMVAGRIHVASGIASEFGDEFTPTSQSNSYTDKLFENRGMVEFNGKNYEIVPDPTLDPTDKYIYVSSNKPAGIFFDKPAGSKVIRKEDDIANEVQTLERALIGYCFPITWAPHVLAVKFKN